MPALVLSVGRKPFVEVDRRSGRVNTEQQNYTPALVVVGL